MVVSGTDLVTDANAKVAVHLAIGKGNTGDPDTNMDLIKAPFDLGFMRLALGAGL